MLCIENVIVGKFPVYQSLGLSSTSTVLITYHLFATYFLKIYSLCFFPYLWHIMIFDVYLFLFLF